MKRVAQPEDMAGAVVFLCSEHAAFITGQVLQIDGGLDIKRPHSRSAARGFLLRPEARISSQHCNYNSFNHDQARMSRTTLPATSVKRKSRPL